MTASTYAGNGWKMVVETDQIEVTSSAPRLDPSWRYTDAAGHVHTPHVVTRASWPTLRWVWDEEDDDLDDRDGHWECQLCGEEISPGMVGPSMFREFIPGPTHVHIELPDGQQLPVSPDEWVTIRNAGPNAESFVAAIVNREANRG